MTHPDYLIKLEEIIRTKTYDKLPKLLEQMRLIPKPLPKKRRWNRSPGCSG